MSRWLANVNSLLERLDGTVETAIEEQQRGPDDEQDDDLGSILAKRGLQQDDEDDNDNDDDDDTPQEQELVDVQMTALSEHDNLIADYSEEQQIDFQPAPETESRQPIVRQHQQERPAVAECEGHSDILEEDSNTSGSVVIVNQEATQDEEEHTQQASGAATLEEAEAPKQNDIGSAQEETGGNTAKKGEFKEEADTEKPPLLDPTKPAETEPAEETSTIPDATNETPEDSPGPPTELVKPSPPPPPLPPKPTPPPPPPKSVPTRAAPPPPPPAPRSVGVSEKDYKQALTASREAQKEARTLRRHVVSLNTQLERAEGELEAQRTELEQAGERLEKDRKKYKEQKEKLTVQNAEAIKTMQKQHEDFVADLKARHEAHLQELQVKLQTAEEKRMQEGGDWTKELQATLDRERDLVRKMAVMEDEKTTLLGQITTLQSQQERLQSRLDSIHQTADNAMMREREAEDKLDMTLSLHARQIAHRQAREAELERTIAELSATLARPSHETNADTAAGAGNFQLKNQIYNLEEELETCKTQLDSERQRVVIMQTELRDMSKERTMEVTSARAKQHQFDRQIADMSLQISKLQSSLREAQKGSNTSSSGFRDSDTPTKHQVNELTEQLVRQQEKMGQAMSELSTLKSRLESANARADRAEKELAQANSFDVESGPESGNFGGAGNDGMRRRGGSSRRKQEIGSIRAAINLTARDENAERLGNAIDAVDQFSVQTGKYLRYNPLARGGFILYLILLHLWTFFVLFLHAHKFETVHGDFGAGHSLAHGPHALMQQHDPEIFKQVTAAAVTKKVAENTIIAPATVVEDPAVAQVDQAAPKVAVST